MQEKLMSRLSKSFKAIFAGVLSVVLAFSMTGCGSSAVAATVNGHEITEDQVSSYIQSVRTSYGLTDDDDWLEYLTTYGYTSADMRNDAIEVIAQEWLISQVAQEAGYTVETSEIDEAIQSLKSQYSSENEWEAALSSQGITESDLRDSYEMYMYQQIVMDEIIEAPTPTDEEIQSAIDENISSYDGAKRSSHILFSTDDEDTALEVLAELQDGADFATMAEEYSTDSSASSGGDVGWDCLVTFVDEYQSALDELSVGEITQELVESEYGYHIIMCTEEFSITDDVTPTADNIPSDIYDVIVSDLEDELLQTAYTEYAAELLEQADIQINTMPEGLAYDVDGSGAAAQASAEAETTETDDSDSTDDTDDESDSTDGSDSSSDTSDETDNSSETSE